MKKILTVFVPYVKKYFLEEMRGTVFKEEREVTYIDKNFKTHKMKFNSGDCPKNLSDDEIFEYFRATIEIAKYYTKQLITLDELDVFFEEVFKMAQDDFEKEEELKLFN